MSYYRQAAIKNIQVNSVLAFPHEVINVADADVKNYVDGIWYSVFYEQYGCKGKEIAWVAAPLNACTYQSEAQAGQQYVIYQCNGYVSTVNYYYDINCSKLQATYTVTKFPGICYDATSHDDDFAESVVLLCSSNPDVSDILPSSTPVLQQVYYGKNSCSGQYVFYDIYTANECLIAGNNELSVQEVEPYSYTWDSLNCSGKPIATTYQPTGCSSGTYTSWYTTADNGSNKNAFSTGAIIGIVIGAFAFIILVGALLFFWRSKTVHANKNTKEDNKMNPMASLDVDRA